MRPITAKFAGEIRLTFILLAHEPPSEIVPLVEAIVGKSEAITLVLHYDAAAPEENYRELERAFASQPRVRLLTERVKCGWGEFSLVDATLRALRAIAISSPVPDRVFLLSASCYPVRPIAELQKFLAIHSDTEFIEAYSDSWIIGGLRSERYKYRHWFNERRHPRLFYSSEYLQRKLKLERSFPEGLTPRFGSQWWCLNWPLCSEILELLDRRPTIVKFFRTTWIPDELFFQTLAYALAPERLSGRSLTYYRFSNQAKPTVFYDDHSQILLRIPFFFARKIAPSARRLKAELLRLAKAPAPEGPPVVHADPLVDFDVSARVREQVSHPKPNQIYYGDQMRGDWGGVLGALRSPIVVLYGPPLVTRLAAAELAKDSTFTVLGRLFAWDKIDFGTRGASFSGLHEGDVKLRDYDPANYAARVFDRCDGIPAFEMAPFDYAQAQGLFHRSRRVIFVICSPEGLRRENTRDEIRSPDPRRRDWLRLFWALSLSVKPSAEPQPVETAAQARAVIDDAVASLRWSEHVRWVEDRIEELDFRYSDVLPLYWSFGDVQGEAATEGDLTQEAAPVNRRAYDDLVSRIIGPVTRKLIGLNWSAALQALDPSLRAAVVKLFNLPEVEVEASRQISLNPAALGEER